MKKMFFLAAAAMLLCGCAAVKPEGYDRVKSAREMYESLDSARVIMVDLSSGDELMDFTFYINKSDEMIFSYRGSGDDGEELAYSNGAEFFYKTADAQEWSVISTSDESYYYNIYSRSYRYPYARGSIFFLDGTSVSTAEITENENGSAAITYVYDADNLNSYAAEQLDNVNSFISLTVAYCIDANGYITEFTEQGTVIDNDGQTSDINIKIIVEDMNNIYEIPCPVDYLAE